MKRKKKVLGESFNIRLGDDCLREIQIAAIAEGRTLSGMVRRICELWVNQWACLRTDPDEYPLQQAHAAPTMDTVVQDVRALTELITKGVNR
jgi:hypothetical protein